MHCFKNTGCLMSFCASFVRACFIWYACIMPMPVCPLASLYVSMHRLVSVFLSLCVRGASKSWRPHTTICVHQSVTYHYKCPHSTRYVSSSHCICVLQSWWGDARRMYVCGCVCCVLCVVCVCVFVCVCVYTHTYIVLYLFLSLFLTRARSRARALSL